jgi:hypothetical protein
MDPRGGNSVSVECGLNWLRRGRSNVWTPYTEQFKFSKYLQNNWHLWAWTSDATLDILLSYNNGEASIPVQSYTLLGRTLLYYTWSLQHLVTYSTLFAFVPTDKQ